MCIMFDVVYYGINFEGLCDYWVGELFDGCMLVDNVFVVEIFVNLFDGGLNLKVEFLIGMLLVI